MWCNGSHARLRIWCRKACWFESSHRYMKNMTKLVNMKNEPYDIYIGRGSKWGCPYTIIKDRPTLAKEIVDTKEEALSKYKEYLLASPELMDSLDELEGKTLGCFCKPEKCHGDVLLELLTQRKLQNYFKNS